jgi:hypothetical protein
MASKNLQAARAQFDAFNRGDLDAAVGAYADGAIIVTDHAQE